MKINKELFGFLAFKILENSNLMVANTVVLGCGDKGKSKSSLSLKKGLFSQDRN